MNSRLRTAIHPWWKDLLSGLRLDSDPPMVSIDGNRSGTKSAQKSKRVLVVEDNIDAARSTALLVADMGHRAEYAINGYVALSVAKRFKPEVVLLDLGLPGLDGFEVCRRIKNDPELQAAQVVVITGYAGNEYREEALAAGCDMHLVKPVAPKLLEDILG